MGTKVRYLSSTYLLNTVCGLFNICILYKYTIYYSFCQKININMFICVPKGVFGSKYILIIDSKRYIVIDEGDQNVIKWMRIEKVQQMQNPSGNIKISYLLKICCYITA